MRSLFRRLFLSGNAKSIAMLSSGNAFGLLIGFFAQPIITRIYHPEHIGGNALIMAIVAMFSCVANGRYDLCIVMAEDDRESDALAVGAMFVSIFVAAAVGVGIVFLMMLSPSTLGAGWWSLAALPFIVQAGFTNVFISFNNRYRQYKLIASVTVIRQTASAVGQIGLGLLGLGTPGLVISQFTAQILGLRQQAKYALGNVRRLAEVKKADILAALKKYRRQPLYNAPAEFMAALSFSLLSFVVNSLYGLKEVGLVSLSITVLGMPMTVISQNVQKVFFQSATAEKRAGGGGFKDSFNSTAAFLLAISIPMFTILKMFSPLLVSLIFGQNWLTAGKYMAILSPYYGMRFVVTVLASSLILGSRQHLQFWLQIGLLAETILIFFIAKYTGMGIEDFLQTLNWFYFAHYGIIFLLSYAASRNTTALD